MENVSKDSVFPTVCVNDTAFFHLTALNIVNFKLLCMSEVLINVAIFVCYCNSHASSLVFILYSD